MCRIKITGDSTIDLSKELLTKNNITIFPLYVNMGDDSYRDGVTIVPDDIYAYVEKTGVLPKTSAPSVGDYLEFFTKVKEDADTVLHFSLGSGFSSSFQNARIASEELDNVYVIDSANLSTGTGLLVLEACEMVKKGATAEEIIKEIEKLIPKVDASFIIHQLDYLAKGGRCSSLVAMGANVLKLRPTILVKDGKMEVGKKYRGAYVDCVKNYIKDRLENGEGIRKKRVFITNTACDGKTLEVAINTVNDLVNFEEVLHTMASCTISTHCGANTLGVLFIRE